ncbi:MAG TPA: DUF1003 domain-containing protein [Candidatus Dormibacteraeota bacterium]|nr:DUF1003 domain-containing protein [Candidatus Dormibacteraeota bacterium]
MSVRTSDSGQLAIKESLHRRKARPEEHKHVVNVIHHEEATFGERLADTISAGIGSWPFLIVQTLAVAAWMVGNAILFFHFDPKPFILLNLLFSIQAAYTGPVLLLAGNRQSQKDRLTLEHAAHEADKADRQNVQILKAIEHNTEVTIQILRHVESLVSGHMAEDAAKNASRQAEQNRT